MTFSFWVNMIFSVWELAHKQLIITEEHLTQNYGVLVCDDLSSGEASAVSRTLDPVLQNTWYHTQENHHLVTAGGGKGKAIPVRCHGGTEVWDVEAPTFSEQSAHGWQWGCEPYTPASSPRTPGRFLYSFLSKRRVDPKATVQLEESGQLKNPMTSCRTEPVTFQLVA
jgi:hypothetical protein